MKFNLHLALFFLIPFLSISQTPVSKITYMDSLWKETTEENYKYYRIVKEYYSDKKIYNVIDHYKSGAIYMVGKSNNKDYLNKDGQFIYYYENGNKKTISNFDKGKQTGKQYNWYENGKPKSEIEYIEIKNETTPELNINQYWDANNNQKVIDGNGDYEDLSETLFESGKTKNGLHEGVWKGYGIKPKYTYTENYENGKLISGTSIDSSNIEHSYKKVNQYPVPKRGMNNFYSYIGKSMSIPIAARNTVSGKIYLTFVIETDGSVVDIKIIKGIGYGIDEEAIRVIKDYKYWNPGILRGIPIRVLYSIPITIVL
ncbi:energy transducer TonB [Flavobacterium sp. K5-23]|uniref:energy transducer TonB n=1 Tax=Flavobacterium sp. K5-23 TaxID=2746225 RepID=UPI00200D5687|nr:energy transducer TonB [Flavobacterium sp. K5-23]UQD55036.1 energy transducer TonB [Flavobacterium sp. K5-23]